LSHTYQDIISVENLLEAWREFVSGKRKRKDVQDFQERLLDNIFVFHGELAHKTYKHSLYTAFKITDPKPRDIHKASVRDRLLHHALYRKLYPFFDRTFIADSYSCREDKGVHKALERFRRFFLKVSKNNTQTVWVLRCDVKKFFASIDHTVLVNILQRCIPDKDILSLLNTIIESFSSTNFGVGLPLGNLTSQLLVNVYMNEFDQFVKHGLKTKHYIRYADDFVLLSPDKEYLQEQLSKIEVFLKENLHLTLHPNKVSITTFASGIDFLGWVHFPDHRVLRTVTKRRMVKNLAKNSENRNVIASYRGLLSHGNTTKLERYLSTNEF
jgi:RNA-directed DNA polymerase